MSQPANQAWGKELHPPRILIVDDNQSIHRDFELVLCEETGNAELAADALRLYGKAERPHIVRPVYALDHALSGMEGVAKVQAALQATRPYQMAFVDIRMPGIDGVETIERIWRIDARIQMVLCTAYADYAQEDLLHRLGTTDKLLVLKKPFDTIEVRQLALALTEKWYLAIQAGLKLEEMELLVARRTQKLLELQRRAPEATPAAAVASDKAAPELELPVILLVEGDAGIRRQIREGMGNQFQWLEARDGREGFELAREGVPDLVLAEVALARLNGFELCRGLKSDELASHIPVILLAADAGETQRRRALEAGADDFCASQSDLTTLRGQVQTLLLGSRSESEDSDRELRLNPREIAQNQMDARFLQRTVDTVEKHLLDFEFDVETLSKKMFMSRRQLFRKLKGVAGCAPNVFIRDLRLKRAAQLLRESAMTVTEITYAVGFSDLKHFRTVFRDHFGLLPGEFGRRAEEPPPG
jgi:CheY-like chemotaxis protein